MKTDGTLLYRECYEALFLHNPDAVFSIDLDGKFISFNPASERISGYSEKELLQMRSFRDLLVPDEVSNVEEHFRKTLEGEAQHFRTDIVRKNGEKVELDITAVPDMANGTITGLYAIAKDITEHKQAEEAHRKSEEKYHTLLSKIQAAVVVHDGSTTAITTFNNHAMELLGLSADQMLGKTAVDLEWMFLSFDGSPMPISDYPVNRVITTGKRLREMIVGIRRPLTNEVVWTLVNAEPVIKEERIEEVIVSFMDITDHKRAEEELAKHRDNLKELVAEQTHDIRERVKEISCLYSISNVIELPNLSIEDMFQKVVNILPPAWQYPEITCARIRIGDKAYITDNFRETKWRQADNIRVEGEQVGSVEVFYLKEMPEMDEGIFLKEERHLINEIAARLARLIIRKQAEEALKKKRHHNELLLDSLPYASMLITKGRVIVAANKAAVDIGVEVGTHCWDTFGKLASIPREDRECFEKHGKAPVGGTKCRHCVADEALANQKSTHVEVTLNGTVWDTYWIPLDSDIFLHYAIDITSRKRYEEELKDSRDWLNKAQEIAHLGNWDQYMTTDKLWWSDEEYRIFGLAPRQLDLTLEKFLEMVHPDDRSMIVEETKLTLDDEGHTFNLEYRLFHPDGSMRTVHEQAEVIRDDNGKPIRMVGTTLDITERKQAEEEIIKNHKRLEELVVIIRAAKEEAEIANRTKSEFLNNMSHELRTPLNQILGFSDLGIMMGDNLTKEKQLSYFSTIHESGKEMLQLVKDLMDLSELDVGKMEFNMKANYLLEVVKIESMKLEKQLEEHSLTLDIIPPDAKTLAIFDEKRIQQVVKNVFSNAIKFSPEGKTITVSFEAESLPARDGGSDSIPAITMTVKDDGVGIPDDELETIFDKFTQSSKTKTGAGGKGVGLAICKKIVAAHNGVITAENHPDGGAVFKVTLPIKPITS